MEQAQAIGKQLIPAAQGAQTDNKRQTFASASYLLMSAGRASFRFTYSDNYNEAWLYSNHGLGLGEPLGLRHRGGQIWRRDFTWGSVWVDPVAHTATIQSP